MAISFNGIGEVVATFAGNTDKGDIVTVGANKTAVKAAAGDAIAGVCVSKGNGVVGVAVAGFVTVKFTGVAPALGYAALTAAGGNAVKAASGDDAEAAVLVVDVDTAAGSVTFLL